jgi:hypothetical protein
LVGFVWILQETEIVDFGAFSLKFCKSCIDLLYCYSKKRKENCKFSESSVNLLNLVKDCPPKNAVSFSVGRKYCGRKKLQRKSKSSLIGMDPVEI